MHHKLDPKQIEDIKKLPQEFQLLAQKYPNSIASAALDWNEPHLSQSDPITEISIYYTDDGEDPDIFINHQRELEDFITNLPSHDVLCVSVSGHWAYIELEGKVILDRIGSLRLPPVEVKSKVIEPLVLLEIN